MIKAILLLCLVVLSNSQITIDKNYTSLNGIQLYFNTDTRAFYYATLTGNSSLLSINFFLYLPDSKDTITAKGKYVGIGFGGNEMSNKDMVICIYFNKNFTCEDYWAPGYMVQKDTDIGGVNNVKFTGADINSVDPIYSPYATLIRWNCTKDLTALDKYDWSGLPNWQTSKSGVIGALGDLSSNGAPVEHRIAPNERQILNDGDGISTTTSSSISLTFNYSLIILIFFSIFF
jgi:hypothetical protein